MLHFLAHLMIQNGSLFQHISFSKIRLIILFSFSLPNRARIIFDQKCTNLEDIWSRLSLSLSLSLSLCLSLKFSKSFSIQRVIQMPPPLHNYGARLKQNGWGSLYFFMFHRCLDGGGHKLQNSKQ